MSEKTVLGFRVSEELKKILLEKAAAENRSLSNFVTNALLTYLKHHLNIHHEEKPD